MTPSDKTRNILVGVAFFIVIVLVVLFLIRRGKSTTTSTFPPLPTTTSSYRQQLQDNFGINVPSSAITADLKDVSGGNQMGLATSDKISGLNDYTVLANLEDPTPGYFYQAWLIRGTMGNTNYDVISLGKLELAKGGWLIDYKTAKDLSDHKNVWVTLERYATNVPGKHILEGSF